jgi:hypothetical protein
MARNVPWRRRPTGVLASREDQKIAGETPAPQKDG